MIRLALLYAPAGWCAVWALLILSTGRSDALSIVGLVLLAVALLLHTCQGIHDRRRGR